MSTNTMIKQKPQNNNRPPRQTVARQVVPAQNVVFQKLRQNKPKTTKKRTEFFTAVVDDLQYASKRLFGQFEVVALYAVGLMFVLMHPDGFSSGPINKWIGGSESNAFTKVLIERFDHFCAVILFIPLYFGVPKNYRGFSIVLSISWVLLMPSVTYIENLMASLFVFYIVTVKDYRTRLVLTLSAVFIYLNFYKTKLSTVPPNQTTTTTARPTTAKPAG